MANDIISLLPNSQLWIHSCIVRYVLLFWFAQECRANVSRHTDVYKDSNNVYKEINVGYSLLGSLDLFLNDQPVFRKDILFAEDNSTVKASRFTCLLKGTSSAVKLRDAMTTLRDDLKDKTTLPVFANAYLFIFIEQFVSTLPETVRNLSLAATAILVVTSLFLVSPLVILLVLLGFVSLIFELLGKVPR